MGEIGRNSRGTQAGRVTLMNGDNGACRVHCQLRYVTHVLSLSSKQKPFVRINNTDTARMTKPLVLIGKA